MTEFQAHHTCQFQAAQVWNRPSVNITPCSTNHVHILSAEQAFTAVVQILDHILEIVLEKVGDNGKVRLTVDSTSLQEAGGGVQIEPVWKSQLTVRRWMDAIELVLQSNKFFLLDEDLIITVEHAQFPTGPCSIKVPELLRAEFRRRRFIIKIKNADNLCMARALVVGKAKADGNIALYNGLKRYPTTQTAHAKKLISDTSFEEREYTIENLSAFERALPGYQLSIVSTSHMNSLIYSGSPTSTLSCCTTTAISICWRRCHLFSIVATTATNARLDTTTGFDIDAKRSAKVVLEWVAQRPRTNRRSIVLIVIEHLLGSIVSITTASVLSQGPTREEDQSASRFFDAKTASALFQCNDAQKTILTAATKRSARHVGGTWIITPTSVLSSQSRWKPPTSRNMHRQSICILILKRTSTAPGCWYPIWRLFRMILATNGFSPHRERPLAEIFRRTCVSSCYTPAIRIISSLLTIFG